MRIKLKEKKKKKNCWPNQFNTFNRSASQTYMVPLHLCCYGNGLIHSRAIPSTRAYGKFLHEKQKDKIAMCMCMSGPHRCSNRGTGPVCTRTSRWDHLTVTHFQWHPRAHCPNSVHVAALSFQKDQVECHTQTGQRHGNVQPCSDYCSCGERTHLYTFVNQYQQ